jgi:WD40 repeat protein/DNA-binding SARP family transcriptional activator
VGIAVLGPVSVEGDAAVLEPRDRVVLASLALWPGEVMTSDRLADALWGDQPPATWRKVIQGCVARLRKVLGAAAIETVHQGYRLVVPVEEVDAQRFERLVVRGRELLTLGEPERARHVLGEGLALWRGQALADLEGWGPAGIEATRLEALRLDAQELVLDAALRSGRYREVLADLQARVSEQPLRERRWALLALAQYQAGRQGEALRTLHGARLTLAGELGLDPGPDLVALEDAILRQDPSLVADGVLPEPSVTCPYLGLVAYDVADAEAFFGRDADVAACVRRLAEVGVLGVVGPSGSGKSSLVRAGVAAALGRDGRRVAVVTPGAHPCDALTALPETGPAPVLVVDQCEEAVALCDDAGEQARFFAALGAHAERGALVLALRADRLGELSAHPGFARLIEPGLYLLGAMGEADLRAAIQGPAHQAGLLLEPGLVELLVREVEGEPGALPLLSHSLRTTWERREGSTLTVEGYRRGGGIRGAVAQSAEDLYQHVPADQRPLVRDLLLRLVAPSPDGEPVRSRVPRRIVGTDPVHEALVEQLVAARLVTSDDGVIELAHEALARAWPRLQGWLDDDVEGQRTLRHLSGTADTWDAMGRPDTELYRGARLTQALEWQDRAHPDLTPTEAAFLEAGQGLVDAERRATEDRARHQARANRRLRSLLVATAVLLVAALVVGVAAVSQRNRAERAGDAATASELAAAANANVDVDSDRSILMALAAVERARSAGGPVLREAEEALHRAVAASRIELHVPGVGGRLDWSPDGTAFVTEGPDDSGVVDVRDAQTGTSLQSFPALEGDINDVAFHPDGTLVATAATDGAARVWDLTTEEELHSIESPVDDGVGAWGVGFSPDGSRFAAAWFRDGVKVMDLASGRIIQEITSVPSPGGVSFDPSGARIAVRSEAEPVVAVVDVGSGAVMFTLDGHLLPATDVAWSPDGTSIATASLDGRARIFDARTGAHRFTTLGRQGQMFDLDWSPDATRLVTANSDGVAAVWKITAAGPQEQLRLSAHELGSGVSGVAFSPDGTQVMAGNFSVTGTTAAVVVWDVTIHGDAEVTNLPAVTTPFGGAVAFTADGRHLVASSADGSAMVWDARTFAPVRTLGSPAGSSPMTASGPTEASGADVFALAVSPDGELVAAARLDGTVRVWDVATGRDAFTVDPGPTLPGAPYTFLAWSPNSDMLAVAANDGSTGRLTIVDRTGRNVTAPRQEPTGIAIGCVRFSPDSEQLITARVPTDPPDPGGYRIVIWDWRTRRVARTIETTAGCAVSSPTGNLIATTAREQGALPGGKVDLWDPDSGQHVASLPNSTGTVALAFSADGSRLATAGHDGTVRIWDPSSGEQLLALDGHDAQVSSVAFSPDGSQLASIGAEGTVRVWALDLDDLVEIGEREVTRPLTEAECRQYLHRPGCP